jgi:hypothetical protein
MAEKKDFMESQDFLGDLFKGVGKSTGASLFEKLATNARQEAIQPLVKSLQIQQFTKPLTELADKAEAAQKAGMAAYIAANPEIDESLLYDGTGDLVNGIMQENNLRFREINRQLSFMDIRNPKYQELANELNKINTTSAQLREDNKKLLGIRNLMKDEDRVEELSKGMSSSQQAMYNDILTGNNQNFVNINGKLHWQDPDNADAEPVAISSVDAAGPTYSNSVVQEKHIGLYNEVINAAFVDDTILHSKINNLWKMDGVGNTGLKSFIFDNQGASDAMGFDTSDWFDQWYKDQGIVGEEAQLAEKERIRNGGVLVDGAFVDLDGDGVPDKKGNVKQHFSAWYHSKMKSNIASQYNKQQATKDKSGYAPFDPEGEEGGDGGKKPKTPPQSKPLYKNKEEAINAIFKQTEDDFAIDILEGADNKAYNILPKGVTMTERNIFDSGVIGFKGGDPLNIFTNLGNYDKLKRFQIKGDSFSVDENEKERFKQVIEIYNMILSGNTPKNLNLEGKTNTQKMQLIYKELYDSSYDNLAPGTSK